MKKTISVLTLLVSAASVQAIEMKPCYIGKNGVSQKAECGTLTVPVNREAPEVTIDLHVARIEALSDKKAEDPLLMLAGGPGQSALDAFAGSARVYQSHLRDRDIILVDQRGTGASHPLRCELDEENENMEALMDPDSDAWKDWLQNCKDSMDVDTRYFTTTEAIKDLEAVREALGIKQWNVYGGSYGTRKAITYMKMFPEALRSVVLDSVVNQEEPLASKHDANIQRTLKAVSDQCKEDTACYRAFGDVESKMWALLARLKETPAELNINNPMTGEKESITFDENYAVMALRMFAYSPETMGLIPLMVSKADEGHYETLAYQALMIGASLEEGLNNALELSVICAEDIPFFGEQPEMDHYLFGERFFELTKARCDIWDSVPVDDSFKQEVVSDIPTLLLSGELDPVTPPQFADLAMKEITGAKHFVAKGQGHIVATRGCMPKIFGAFVRDPKAELDTACMDNFQTLSFFINMNGPQE